MRKEFRRFAERLSFIWYDGQPFADILKHAAALPPHSAIFWLSDECGCGRCRVRGRHCVEKALRRGKRAHIHP